jgi:hypothetical protein
MTSPARSDPAPVAPRPVRTAVASGHGPVGSVQPRTASAATVGSAPAASSPADDADLALYRVAHEAHFVARDPSAALAAWDQYLAAQPQGRFALEARYNRAISLLRVGRRDEGLAALRVFADGTNGGYRQAEARRILDAQAPQTAPR